FKGPGLLIPTPNAEPLVQTANAASAATNDVRQAVCEESDASTAARSGGRSSSTPSLTTPCPYRSVAALPNTYI
ncbi:MAG: hypothetical protein J2P37_29710, partial [Ktedonobacteraceae bacterium]|nr:hypothetical protein [Ktedonobacteraceae bacterium]